MFSPLFHNFSLHLYKLCRRLHKLEEGTGENLSSVGIEGRVDAAGAGEKLDTEGGRGRVDTAGVGRSILMPWK